MAEVVKIVWEHIQVRARPRHQSAAMHAAVHSRLLAGRRWLLLHAAGTDLCAAQSAMTHTMPAAPRHVPQDMEPGLSPSSVGVWLSCCAVNPHNPAHHVAADMAAVDRALRDALPTLVCMEQAGAAQPAAGTSTADPLPPNLPAQVGGSHVPALTLYRAREGLRGFQGAMFNTVRISYL